MSVVVCCSFFPIRISANKHICQFVEEETNGRIACRSAIVWNKQRERRQCDSRFEWPDRHIDQLTLMWRWMIINVVIQRIAVSIIPKHGNWPLEGTDYCLYYAPRLPVIHLHYCGSCCATVRGALLCVQVLPLQRRNKLICITSQ